MPVVHTLHGPSGGVAPIWDVAERHRTAGEAVVLERVLRADGGVEAYTATAAVETQLQARLLREGGVIPAILEQALAEARAGH